MGDLSLNVPDALVDAIADRVAERLTATAPPAPTADRPDGKLALSIAEAAESLGVSVDHFRRHISPDLRIVRSGRLRLVPVAELERWLDRNAARALAGARLAHDPPRPHGKRDRGQGQGTDPGADRGGRS